MKSFNEFTVKFPIEVVSEWVKEDGVNSGIILESQDVVLDEISLQDDYVIMHGTLERNFDS